MINMRTGVSILSQLHISIEISGEKVSYSDISGLSFSHLNVVRSVEIKSAENVWPLPSIASSDPETEKGGLRFMMWISFSGFIQRKRKVDNLLQFIGHAASATGHWSGETSGTLTIAD